MCLRIRIERLVEACFGDQIVTIWNISQVNGLVPAESLMILGSSHLYLIENYILSKRRQCY